MSAPLAEVAVAQDQLLDLLSLVDASRARTLALEEQFSADLSVLYAERLSAARVEGESAEVLNAPFLASLVLLIRRALSAGVEEGGRFATAQFGALDLPAVLIDEVEIPFSEIGDKIVRDFLSGQVEVVRGPAALDIKFGEMLKRAQLAMISALHAGRGVATESAFAAVADVVQTPLHKLWVARFDLATPPCRMCVRLHGQHVPIGSAFTSLKTEPAPYAGQLTSPPRHPQCRCALVLYVPGTLEKASEGVTPLSMQSYASWALSMSEQERSEYLAATVVRVKAYTRMVDGQLQHVSGYYYNIQTGQKIPEGQWRGAPVKEVSAQQARQITQKSKAANKSTPKGGAPDLNWKPGTYRVDVPNSDDDTQVIVHQDGSSTSIHKGQVAEADKAQTAQFLSLYQQHGLVQKVSDDPDVPDRSGPGPQLEPSDDDKQQATLADGHYILRNHPTYGGVHVKPDGTGELYFKDFKKKLPLKQVAISQIAKGNLGEFEEVDENEFTEDWYKQFQQSRAGGAKPPRQGTSGQQGQVPGQNGDSSAQQGASAQDVDAEVYARIEDAFGQSSNPSQTVLPEEHRPALVKYLARQKDFTGLLEMIKGISFSKAKKSGLHTPGEWLSGGGLELSPQMFNGEWDRLRYEVMAKEDQGGNRTFVRPQAVTNGEATPTDIVVSHEMGHAAEDLAGRKGKLDAFTALAKAAGLPEPEPVMTDYNDGQPEVVDELSTVEKWISQKKVRSFLTKNVSVYGAGNHAEAFAELWAYYSIDRDNAPDWVRAFGDTVASAMKQNAKHYPHVAQKIADFEAKKAASQQSTSNQPNAPGSSPDASPQQAPNAPQQAPNAPQQAPDPNAPYNPADNAPPGVNVPGVATRSGQQQAPQQPQAPNAPGGPQGAAPGAQQPTQGLPEPVPGSTPDFASIPDVNLPGEPPQLPNQTGAGIVVVEPDGSIWLYEPKGRFAGYENTFPKGGLEDGLSLQQSAHKELWEETGITADITGYLGDYRHGNSGRMRMYVATRRGGTPKPDDPSPYVEGGNEAAKVKNVSPEEAAKLLNVNRDKRILKDLQQFGTQGRPPAQPGDPQPAWMQQNQQQSAAPGPQGAPGASAPQGGMQTGPLREALNNRRAGGRDQTLDEALDDVARPANAGNAPGDSVSSNEQQDVPEAPEGGPGGVVKGGPALFPVGKHSVQIEEGSQVYRSSKSKDTLYVLQPNGDLIKYNPQGAGVQATRVGSSENPAARAQQLAKLDNVTDDLGTPIKNQMPPPGTGKALVGGFEMSSKQLDDAIAALSSNPSGNVAADLKKVGSPLAAGKFHEVAAPYKAYFDNKTKPALIHALKKAQAHTGSTPDAEAPRVAHLLEAHGLEDHHASLGHADTEAIHAALHAVDPDGSDHSHANDGPGFISIDGTPLPPATVAHAIDALKKTPSKETGVKKPLKAAGSPLANMDLQSLVNNSEITNSFKGSNGKVHYGKLKPAVIALLTDALDKHQTKNPPSPTSAPPAPEPLRSIQGVHATQADILEMQQFFATIDLDEHPDPELALKSVAHNPLALGVDWDDFIEAKAAKSGIQNPSLSQANQLLHDGLNDYLDKKTPLRSRATSAPKKPEDTSPPLTIGGSSGTVNQLIEYKNALSRMTGFGSMSGKLSDDNAFSKLSVDAMAAYFDVPDDAEFPKLKQVLADELQKSIDKALLKKQLPPPVKPDASLSKISVGGTQVSKADLLAAIDAVKNSPSTGVKGPLKAIDSPLAKVDLKSYIESDPLSDPYKGSNGKVHYGKLKDAVAAVLQSKADQMGDAELPPDPDVTPAGDASPEVDAPSVEAPVSRAPGAPSFQAVDPVDDFFSDDVPTTPSSGELTPDQKLSQAVQNADIAEDLPEMEGGFPVAFQQAVKSGNTHYADDEVWSPDESDFAGGWYYEINPDGSAWEVDEDGNYKKLSPQQILNQLDGKFDQVGGSLEEATAEVDLPEVGFYTSPAAGLSLKIYPDGSGLVTNLHSGEKVNVDSALSVKQMLDSGAWTKVSDSPDELGKAHVNGVEVGYYATHGPGGSTLSATVLPDGTVYIHSDYSEAVMDVATAKPHLQALGKAPQPIPADPPDWVASVPKGQGGLAHGDYDLGFGEVYTVSGDGIKVKGGTEEVSADFIASLIFSGDAHYKKPFWADQDDDDIEIDDSFYDDPFGADEDDPFASVDDVGPGTGSVDVPVPGQSVGELPDGPGSAEKLSALVEKAKASPDLDPDDPGVKNLSVAFQKAVKSGKTHYSSPAGVFRDAPTSSPYVAVQPDGKIAVHASDGSKMGDWSAEEIVIEMDDLFPGPSVLDPVPPAPSSADEINTSGMWEGHPIGTYTNGEGQFIEIGPEGPVLSEEDVADGLDFDQVLEMIDSGDLSFVPPLDSPAPSTPQQHFDSDAPKLQPFTNPGYTNLDWVDKPVLLSAAKQWAAESGFGGVAAQHLNNATKKEDLIAWLNHWANGEWDKAYEIEAKKVKSHKTKATHPGSPDNPANAGGFTKKKMPPLVDGELPAGVVPDGAWPEDVSSYHAWSPELVDAYMLAANMQNPTGLHPGQKKKWVMAHIKGDKLATDNLSYAGQKNVSQGFHQSDPILPEVEKYGPGQAVPLPSDFPGIDYSKSAVSGWSNKQLDTYLNHIVPTKKGFDFLAKQSPDTKAAIVSLHAVSAAPPGTQTFKDPAEAKKQFAELLKKVGQTSGWNEPETTSFIHNALKVEKKTFTKNKEQPPLGGGSSSTITQVTDEQGNQWLHKSYPEDFRVDVEHAGHELAQLSGIQVADSMVGTFEGKYGQFQVKIPSQGTLQGIAPTDLELSALKDLMAAHVQDWATSNDDAHGDNFLLSPDGKRVIPIDIARSFARFGNPSGMKLKVGQLSDWTTPYYDKVYKAALSGKLSESDVDELYRASIKQANRTAGVADADWEAVIRNGLKSRTNWGTTSAKNLDELVQQALARKNALPNDFEKFWDGIYSQLGRSKPEFKNASLSQWTYSGVSQDYLTHAKNMRNQGAATFFGGTALEDGHLLAQVLEKAGGGEELHLSGQLRQDADKKLRAWLESHVSETIGSTASETEQKTNAILAQLGVEDYSKIIVAAAKTISFHHKQGDKDYNTTHIANFEALRKEIDQKLADFDAGKLPEVAKKNGDLKKEYGDFLRYYKWQVGKIDLLIESNGQSKPGDYDPYEFTLPQEPAIRPEIVKDFVVKKLPSYFDEAELTDDGGLKLTGKTVTTGQSGMSYQVTLSDGTQIEYRSWSPADNVRKTQQGQLRIKVRDYDGTTAGSQAALTALSKMGVDLKDATEEDLELFYWRHLYGVLNERKGRDKGKYKQLIDEVKSTLPGGSEGTPALSAKEELDRWRAAWSRLDPEKFNTFLSGKGWMPRFHRFPNSPDLRGGQPYWRRFDIDYEDVRKEDFLVHALFDPGVAGTVVKSGGLLSTEDRTKILGKWSGGSSSTSDQSYGSAAYVFTRQGGSSYAQVYIDPRVLARTNNYSYNTDNFGSTDKRASQSPFDFKDITQYKSSGNETMIKHGLSFMDDFELLVFKNESDRQEAIQYLKSRGITTMRGMLIEDRLVTSANRDKALKKIREHRAKYMPGEEEW